MESVNILKCVNLHYRI